jgi:hypothetical protein
VLRNAYLTHFEKQHPEKMAIDLSSERVRTALAFLEGVNNGQELGSLLGYQFERGLHDHYGDLGLNTFIPLFRKRFPLVADKVTQDVTGEQIETREARNVFDGYALLDAAFIQDPPLTYPYGITGLPAEKSERGKAILTEVARMAESLDAIADLSLAEGVYQVAQGNFERAGGMLKAMTQGETPPVPEIVHTPRGGNALTQRVVLHLQPGMVASPWAGTLTPRSTIESGLNAWIGELLPRPGKIQYAVRLAGGSLIQHGLVGLGLQPIDLVYLIGEDLAGETTELESRIVFQHHSLQQNDDLEVQIDFMPELQDPQAVTLFELLPMLRALRKLITTSRPLGARDYQLPSETHFNLAESSNPLEIIQQELEIAKELKSRVGTALEAFRSAVDTLKSAIPPNGVDEQPDPSRANAADLRTALRKLADFGVPDALPRSAFGGSDEAKSRLTRQAVNIYAVADPNLKQAELLKEAGDKALTLAEESRVRAAQNLGNAEVLKAEGDKALTSGEESVVSYRSSAQAIFGPAFNLIPAFNVKNRAELRAAAQFRDAAPPNNLTRHHQDNPLILDEWLQGTAVVQPNIATLETIYLLGENFGTPGTQNKPLQLPFRRADHWVAAPFPENYHPEGEFLSILQVLPQTGFQPNETQSGLVVDEWVEVLPNRFETTGIAFHFNQPNSEPPQALLLAVTPEIIGNWTWDKLVGVLQNTFYRAQLRAVEPDQIGDTFLAQLLPAIVSPVTSRPFVTISMDLIHQTALRFTKDLEE